ncbi:MAG: dephospho-CoA kinase [Thermoleophilaceae bacterium]
MSPSYGQRPTATAFIGLTGGIAAGKSEALRALRRLGAATLSTDEVVHELLAEDELRDQVVERLGAVVLRGGRLDRGAIADAVFERADERAWLEELLWPRVGERVVEWRAHQERREPPPVAAIVEVPLLFEAEMEAVFDATIAVVADDETRGRRASERGHRALESRTARQLDQDEKARRADFVVENDGDLDDLEESLSGVLATIGA